MQALENAMQHEILLNLLEGSDDFEFKSFLLENIDDFKYGDLAIHFWNRCTEKYRISKLDSALNDFMNAMNQIQREIALSTIKELI